MLTSPRPIRGNRKTNFAWIHSTKHPIFNRVFCCFSLATQGQGGVAVEKVFLVEIFNDIKHEVFQLATSQSSSRL